MLLVKLPRLLIYCPKNSAVEAIMVDNKVKFSDSSVLEAVSTAVKAAVVEAAALDVRDQFDFGRCSL